MILSLLYGHVEPAAQPVAAFVRREVFSRQTNRHFQRVGTIVVIAQWELLELFD